MSGTVGTNYCKACSTSRGHNHFSKDPDGKLCDGCWDINQQTNGAAKLVAAYKHATPGLNLEFAGHQSLQPPSFWQAYGEYMLGELTEEELMLYAEGEN